MNSYVTKKINERAQQANKRVVLPEAEDLRVLQAAEQIIAKKYARITLLGDPCVVNKLAKENGVDLDGVEIVNPMEDADREKYIETILERRKAKGMTRQDAEKLMERVVYYGGMMVGDGRADGMVAGSICPTRDTVRSALFGVGLTDGNSTVSSCSIMNTKMLDIGVQGSLIFADTGVVPEPTAEQLADIALAAADACRSLMDTEPCVAMLSFSTKGSAYSPAVQKVIDATKIAQQRRPELNIDGELQLDAAIIPDIASRKAKNSPVAGKANTLVFPDLSCGNIAYKLVERLGAATALGPLLLGLRKPINDLSRGCSTLDIELITSITAVQSI